MNGWEEDDLADIYDRSDRSEEWMWTTGEAVNFCRKYASAAFACGWNLHLGGGLLTKKDTSNKDADILVMPRWQTSRHDKEGFLRTLHADGWRLSEEFSLPHREIHALRRVDKVVEIIFVVLPNDELRDAGGRSQ